MNGKDRGLKVAVIAALVISVIAIGVGFAAFTETLTIAGSATVQTSSWKVKFTDLSSPTLGGGATVVTAPTINTNDTTISTYDVKLATPGDSVTYTFNVANTGTYDAELTSVTIPSKPVCTGTGDTATDDATKVCKHITYTLEYANAKDDGSKTLANGDTLKAGDSIAMVLKLSYDAHNVAEDLPSGDVTLSDLGISLIYSQK